jgi:hypothetical protein
MQRPGTRSPGKYVLHTADHPANQSHFDAMRVTRGTGENILNDSFRQFPRPLILFLHNLHPNSGCNDRTLFSVHWRIWRWGMGLPLLKFKAFPHALLRAANNYALLPAAPAFSLYSPHQSAGSTVGQELELLSVARGGIGG